MKKDIEDYSLYLPNFFDKKLCKQTIKELNKINKKNWQEHLFYDDISKTKYSPSGQQELSILYTKKINTVEFIEKKIGEAINTYINHLNFNWFRCVSAYSPIRFNKYSKNKKMAEHCDHIHSLFDGEKKGIPTLTILGFLNDDYKGGELIMFQDKVLHVKAGGVLIFPSIFLYPHKVEPVKKGTRYSFVSWAW